MEIYSECSNGGLLIQEKHISAGVLNQWRTPHPNDVYSVLVTIEIGNMATLLLSSPVYYEQRLTQSMIIILTEFECFISCNATNHHQTKHKFIHYFKNFNQISNNYSLKSQTASKN